MMGNVVHSGEWLQDSADGSVHQSYIPLGTPTSSAR